MYRHPLDAILCTFRLGTTEATIGLERGTLLPVVVGLAVKDVPLQFRNVQALITRSNTINPDELNRLIKDVRHFTDTQRQTTRKPAREPWEIAEDNAAIARRPQEEDNAAIARRPQQASKKAFVSYAT